MTSKSKTIEETYKKLKPIEHILLRPGRHIGEVKKRDEEMWIMKENVMEKKVISYSPGFIKIFDEILTNATDHSVRKLKEPVTIIKVEYDIETGEISVYNNGDGIPIEKHKEHGIYVPELIFGHLLTGSNYNDDTDDRIGAGSHGEGSKLTNIYSKNFVVETLSNKKKYIQKYFDNMSNKSEPKITSASSGKSYTKITFIPDYNRFGMKGLEKETCYLINKRVYDCITCTDKNVKIYLNGNLLKGKGMSDYIKYYFDESKIHEEKIKIFSEIHQEKIGKNTFIWEYAIVKSDEYQQISFCNGNNTLHGGKHVDYIMYQITNKLKKMIEEKKKLKNITTNMIKDRMFFFLRATVVNPTWGSQTKETMTLQSKDFGCKVEVSDTYIEKLYKSDITNEIVDFVKTKETMALSRQTDGKKVTKLIMPKLQDAILAGGVKSKECTLILTEGDSASSFAKWGITDPQRYGIFPLKGKLLNVRGATISQLINNVEINSLKQIIGLKENHNYKDVSQLRYGKIMILTDADLDGFHIRGLIINFFHTQWPSLTKLDFIQAFQTPIVIATKGKGKNEIKKEFFIVQDFDKWKSQCDDFNTWQILYFKGLGSSEEEDAVNAFKRIDDLTINYYHKDKKCDEAIFLAFDKDKNKSKGKVKEDDETNSTDSNFLNCTDTRKEWLSNYDRNNYLDFKSKHVSYQDQINKELIQFSIADNQRSIPSLCDGLKPTQRKILHYMLKHNTNKSKVAGVSSLAGYIAGEMAYHQGSASLEGTIVCMAQNFLGSNNINLLYPHGNFGARFLGRDAHDAASSRYIKTYLQDITFKIFNTNDMPILNYLKDDEGKPIEPDWFLPIIPMILVNGCKGIGSGWSSEIPNYNPKDIITNLLRVLNDDLDPLPMKPYYSYYDQNTKKREKFKGQILEVEGKEGHYISKGKWERIDDTKIRITELPVGTWITDYKEFTESLIEGTSSKKTKENEKPKRNSKKIILKDSTNFPKKENNYIDFRIEFKSKKELDDLISNVKLETELKLIKKISTNNMVLFDKDLKIKRYSTANDILLEFFDIRIVYYQKRKEYITNKLIHDLLVLENKKRFIAEYINKLLDINKKTKQVIIKLLKDKDYLQVENENGTGTPFDYLLNMPIYSLTLERIDDLKQKMILKQKEIDFINSQTKEDLWRTDLEDLLKQF
jgi:DNA topoisomerase-2